MEAHLTSFYLFIYLFYLLFVCCFFFRTETSDFQTNCTDFLPEQGKVLI